MKWTKELPTEEGWYWYMYGNDKSILGIEYLCPHLGQGDGLTMPGLNYEPVFLSLSDWVDGLDYTAYFYGPIQPPGWEEEGE